MKNISGHPQGPNAPPTMSEDSSDEEDYDAFNDAHHTMEKRYPLHDCCDLEDVEALRVSRETSENRGAGGVDAVERDF